MNIFHSILLCVVIFVESDQGEWSYNINYWPIHKPCFLVVSCVLDKKSDYKRIGFVKWCKIMRVFVSIHVLERLMPQTSMRNAFVKFSKENCSLREWWLFSMALKAKWTERLLKEKLESRVKIAERESLSTRIYSCNKRNETHLKLWNQAIDVVKDHWKRGSHYVLKIDRLRREVKVCEQWTTHQRVSCWKMLVMFRARIFLNKPWFRFIWYLYSYLKWIFNDAWWISQSLWV